MSFGQNILLPLAQLLTIEAQTHHLNNHTTWTLIHLHLYQNWLPSSFLWLQVKYQSLHLIWLQLQIYLHCVFIIWNFHDAFIVQMFNLLPYSHFKVYAPLVPNFFIIRHHSHNKLRQRHFIVFSLWLCVSSWQHKLLECFWELCQVLTCLVGRQIMSLW